MFEIEFCVENICILRFVGVQYVVEFFYYVGLVSYDIFLNGQNCFVFCQSFCDGLVFMVGLVISKVVVEFQILVCDVCGLLSCGFVQQEFFEVEVVYYLGVC